jgi:hypothetical protein
MLASGDVLYSAVLTARHQGPNYDNLAHHPAIFVAIRSIEDSSVCGHGKAKLLSRQN